MFEQLISEFKEDFQIPPFYSDKTLLNYAREGYQYLNSKKEFNLETDLTGRSLLKNYMLYAYYKKLDEFETNYLSNVYGWMLE